MATEYGSAVLTPRFVVAVRKHGAVVALLDDVVGHDRMHHRIKGKFGTTPGTIDDVVVFLRDGTWRRIRLRRKSEARSLAAALAHRLPWARAGFEREDWKAPTPFVERADGARVAHS